MLISVGVCLYIYTILPHEISKAKVYIIQKNMCNRLLRVISHWVWNISGARAETFRIQSPFCWPRIIMIILAPGTFVSCTWFWTMTIRRQNQQTVLKWNVFLLKTNYIPYILRHLLEKVDDFSISAFPFASVVGYGVVSVSGCVRWRVWVLGPFENPSDGASGRENLT